MLSAHVWATGFCIGVSSGSARHTLLEAGVPTFDALMHSRELGAKVQFTDQGAGFYGDCPSAAHGVSPVDQ
jgi:hypothetical protein